MKKTDILFVVDPDNEAFDNKILESRIKSFNGSVIILADNYVEEEDPTYAEYARLVFYKYQFLNDPRTLISNVWKSLEEDEEVGDLYVCGYFSTIDLAYNILSNRPYLPSDNLTVYQNLFSYDEVAIKRSPLDVMASCGVEIIEYRDEN